jgi:hypothetical protein
MLALNAPRAELCFIMGKVVLRFAEVWIKLSCVPARLGCGTVGNRNAGQAGRQTAEKEECWVEVAAGGR